MLYHTLLKTHNLDRAKAPGLSDRKRLNIKNMKPLAIAESRELSRGPKCEFSAECGMKSEDKQILQERLKEISDRMERGESLNPAFKNSDLDTLYTLAYSLYQSGNYSQAKEVFHRLVHAKPLKKEYWFALGAALQLEKNYTQSLYAWGMASILDGNDPTPHFHAAECSFATGDRDQGFEALKAAKKHLNSSHEELKAKILKLETEKKNG